jgi:hypothetical protein
MPWSFLFLPSSKPINGFEPLALKRLGGKIDFVYGTMTLLKKSVIT